MLVSSAPSHNEHPSEDFLCHLPRRIPTHTSKHACTTHNELEAKRRRSCYIRESDSRLLRAGKGRGGQVPCKVQSDGPYLSFGFRIVVRKFAVIRDSADTRWTHHHGESSYNSTGSFPFLLFLPRARGWGDCSLRGNVSLERLEVPI